MKNLFKFAAFGALLAVTATAKADVTVGVDPTAAFVGYMNVSELPTNGGGYVFGSVWGTADLNAAFSGAVLTYTPNTSIARDVPTTDGFWWRTDPDTQKIEGNKTMDSNFYVENNDTLPGQTVTFTGKVLTNTLVSPYKESAVAFVKDFAPDFSSHTQVTALLTPGVFTITLPTTAGDHVQYGFEMIGPNARLDEEPAFGSVTITAAASGPSPYTLADAVSALKEVGGLSSASSADNTRFDVESPAGLQLADALRILRKAASTDTNP